LTYVMLDEPVDGLRITHTLEGSFRHSKFGVEILDVLGNGRVRHCDLKYANHDMLKVVKEVIEGNKIEFGLNMCVFGKMASGE
jgi:hypothetical protein